MNTLPRNEYVPFEPPHSLCQQPVALSSICRWQSVRLIATFFATLLVCFFSMAQPAFAHSDVVVAPDGTLHSPVEVVLSACLDIRPLNGYEIVSVFSRLLVPNPGGMCNLMDNCLETATNTTIEIGVLKVDKLLTSLPADVGGTP